MNGARLAQRPLLRLLLLESRPATTTTTRQTLRHTSQQLFRTRPTPTLPSFRSLHTQRNTFFSAAARSRGAARPSRNTHTTRRGAYSTASSSSAAAEAKPSLSQRLKTLSREYGWAAVGVYFALSALDFPFCFLAVQVLGTERIGHWEHVVLSRVKALVKWPLPETAQDSVDEGADMVKAVLKEKLDIEDRAAKRVLEEDATGATTVGEEVVDHGYKAAEAANHGNNASIWTQLALAYAIHKSFIFLRVPLTAAVTPKVVKTLRGWGWNIGKMPKRGGASGSGSGVNTKGSKVKDD